MYIPAYIPADGTYSGNRYRRSETYVVWETAESGLHCRIRGGAGRLPRYWAESRYIFGIKEAGLSYHVKHRLFSLVVTCASQTMLLIAFP